MCPAPQHTASPLGRGLARAGQEVRTGRTPVSREQRQRPGRDWTRMAEGRGDATNCSRGTLGRVPGPRALEGLLGPATQ